MSNTVVIGIGNVLLSDDGAGIYAIRELEKRSLPSGVSLIEGGTGGIEIMQHIQQGRNVLIIDSVDTGSKPGTIYKFYYDEASLSTETRISMHDLGPIEVCYLAESWGVLREKPIIFGIQPQSLDWGFELTLEVSRKLPELVELVEEFLWGQGIWSLNPETHIFTNSNDVKNPL